MRNWTWVFRISCNIVGKSLANRHFCGNLRQGCWNLGNDWSPRWLSKVLAFSWILRRVPGKVSSVINLEAPIGSGSNYTKHRHTTFVIETPFVHVLSLLAKSASHTHSWASTWEPRTVGTVRRTVRCRRTVRLRTVRWSLNKNFRITCVLLTFRTFRIWNPRRSNISRYRPVFRLHERRCLQTVSY